jgi:hypothetical protein
MNYIVCSYGGSGSWMLVNYLKNFGNAYHVHQRYPPKKLTYPDHATEKFTNKEIEPIDLDHWKVIFIYKNPIKAIYSRFDSIYHLRNIESKELNFDKIFKSSTDIFGITEYYNNYMTELDRNYKIYCVKYENFFDKIDEFNNILGLVPNGLKMPIRQETYRHQKHYQHLLNIYQKLIEDQNNRSFIEIN